MNELRHYQAPPYARTFNIVLDVNWPTPTLSFTLPVSPRYNTSSMSQDVMQVVILTCWRRKQCRDSQPTVEEEEREGDSSIRELFTCCGGGIISE